MFLYFMTQPESGIEIFGFILINIITLIFGSILSILSYRVYRQRGNQSFKVATVGFVTVTVGTIVEAMYELGIRRSFELTGRELITLHTIESLLLAIGLGLLFYSIIQR